jgi:hypothetical protein
MNDDNSQSFIFKTSSFHKSYIIKNLYKNIYIYFNVITQNKNKL